MNVPEKILDQIRKIHKLSTEGVDGEMTAAKSALDRILKKYGITIEEVVSNESIETYNVTAKTIFERQLFHQICYMFRCDSGSYKGSRKLWVDANKSQYIDIDCAFDFYKRLLKKEMSIFFKAFVQSQRLFSENKCEKGSDACKLSMEERLKIIQMSKSIDHQTLRKQIENT